MRILIIAGEPSGDALGGNLATALKASNPRIELYGMGGRHMKKAGVNIFMPIDALAIIGVFASIKQIRALFKAKQFIRSRLKTHAFDLVIFIDFPGFNLHMCRYAKKAACTILYYGSPQIWAWRYRRIKKIKRYVDHMAVLFPFEKDLYQKAGIPVTFVGHPLANRIPHPPSPDSYQTYALSDKHPIISLLPGSRLSEVQSLLPIMVAATHQIKKRLPMAQFIVILAPNLSYTQIAPFLGSSPITVIQNSEAHLLSIVHAAIATSGTITLETALQHIPTIILYKTTPLNYWLAKQLIKVRWLGLPNLIAERLVMPELIQSAATPEAITQYIDHVFQDTHYQQQQIRGLQVVSQKLGHIDATDTIATLALKLATDTSS